MQIPLRLFPKPSIPYPHSHSHYQFPIHSSLLFRDILITSTMIDAVHPPNSRDGLVWVDGGLDLAPRWARIPEIHSIEAVCRRELAIEPSDPCAVTFYAAGGFNKLYLINTSSGKSLLRVSLPVDPQHKTRSEVATLRWIRRFTNVPVPRVIAFDDSQDNEIGFEWMLMELMKGEPAYKRWRTMSWSEKTWFVEQVADFQTQLFRQSYDTTKFRSIGTLCADNASATDVKPGRIVAMPFFWGNNFNYDIPRGPYQSSHDWLAAYLAVIRNEQTDIVKRIDALDTPDEDDQDEKDDAQKCLALVTKLESVLPTIFPRLVAPAERTVLWHNDLSLTNILIDQDAKITAVLDWECVSVKPLWVAAGTPTFLYGPNREEEPDRDEYGDETESEKKAAEEDEDALDNQGKCELYWLNRMEYDQTQLRKIYTAKLKLWPRWAEEAEDNSLKADFYEAVSQCASGWHLTAIGQWADAIELEQNDVGQGAPAVPRLMEFLDPTGMLNNR